MARNDHCSLRVAFFVEFGGTRRVREHVKRWRGTVNGGGASSSDSFKHGLAREKGESPSQRRTFVANKLALGDATAAAERGWK